MGWFQSKEEELAALRLDEQVYATVSNEISSGEVRPGLWAKAVAEASGDLRKAQDKYIKLRVSQIRLEGSVAANVVSREAARVAKLPYRCTKCGGYDIEFGAEAFGLKILPCCTPCATASYLVKNR